MVVKYNYNLVVYMFRFFKYLLVGLMVLVAPVIMGSSTSSDVSYIKYSYFSWGDLNRSDDVAYITPACSDNNVESYCLFRVPAYNYKVREMGPTHFELFNCNIDYLGNDIYKTRCRLLDLIEQADVNGGSLDSEINNILLDKAGGPDYFYD